MLGVDFVISALFETSGVRCEGVCARLLPELITSKTKATKKKLINFTAEFYCAAANRKAQITSDIPETSVALFQFRKQFLF